MFLLSSPNTILSTLVASLSLLPLNSLLPSPSSSKSLLLKTTSAAAPTKLPRLSTRTTLISSSSPPTPIPLKLSSIFLFFAKIRTCLTFGCLLQRLLAVLQAVLVPSLLLLFVINTMKRLSLLRVSTLFVSPLRSFYFNK